jgi:hypothetical protein
MQGKPGKAVAFEALDCPATIPENGVLSKNRAATSCPYRCRSCAKLPTLPIFYFSLMLQQLARFPQVPIISAIGKK